MDIRNRGGVTCRLSQTKDGTRPKKSWAKSAQVPMSWVSCTASWKRIERLSIQNPGGRTVIKNSIVRGWITS